MSKRPEPPAPCPGLIIEAPLFRVRKGLRIGFQGDAETPVVHASKGSTALRSLLLAHRWHQSLEQGEVGSPAKLATRLQVSQQRVSMVLALIFLAPDLQEEILGLRPTRRLDTLGLQALLNLARIPSWETQRATLRSKAGVTRPLPENNRGGIRA